MMPNKTIYVSEADLPVFDEAQRLAGDNLSSTIAHALQRFVDTERAREQGFEEITVKVGKAVQVQKRFLGRLLAEGRIEGAGLPTDDRYRVYETARGQLAVHKLASPTITEALKDSRDNLTLEVYESLEGLREHIPEELYHAVERALSDDPIEFLDI